MKVLEQLNYLQPVNLLMTSIAVAGQAPGVPVLASSSRAESSSEEDEEKLPQKQPSGSPSTSDSKEGQPSGHDTSLDFPWRWKVTALCLSIFLSCEYLHMLLP